MHNIWYINKKHEGMGTKFLWVCGIWLWWNIDHDRGKNSIATRLKEKVKFFLTFVYCVAHKTNLTVIDVIKSRPCKGMSRELDAFSDSIALHFKNLCKIKKCVALIAKKLNFTKCLKRYHKIR